MTATISRRIALPLVTTCMLLLILVPIAGAGSYQVNYGPALGAGWSQLRAPGITVNGNVVSTNGPVAQGAFGGLVFAVPSHDLIIDGGSIDITYATGQEMRSVVRSVVGPTTPSAFVGGGSTSRSVTIPSVSARALQVGLLANVAFANTNFNTNSNTVAAASLLLRDLSEPFVTPSVVPSPTRWYSGTDCIHTIYEASDDDSGVMSIRLRAVAGDVTVHTWSATPAPGPMPGVDMKTYNGCVPASVRTHGTSQFEFIAYNASGDKAVARFSIKTDRTTPLITDGPADRIDQEAPHSLAPFRVKDPDSGIVQVVARVDGTAVATTTSDTGTVQLGTAPLGTGVHVIELTATDAVGNVATTERRINVVDTTPPVLERMTPGEGGATSFDLLLHARDAVSGIRASSWSVTVNGGAIAGSGDADSFTATVASLAPGVHRIEATVSDLAGNRTTMAFIYRASAPADMPQDIADLITQHVTSQTAQTVTAATGGASDPAAAAAAGGTSTSSGTLGAWIVRGATTNATFGMPVEVTVFVARAGRAVAGRRISVERAGVELATATTGDDGLARIGYTAGQPGAHRVVIEGLEPMALQVQVAPRVLLASTRTTRRGAKVRVTGRLQPALSGHVLSLEARSGSGWFVVRRGVKTGRGGTFSTSFTANARGRFQLRVRVVARNGWQAATSPTTLLTVR